MRKTCPTCKVNKNIDEFYPSKSTKSGIRSTCKSCCSEERKRQYSKNADKEKLYHKITYAENPEKFKERSNEWHAKNPERTSFLSKKWIVNNKERDKERKRKWYNPDWEIK
jgi:hypothetical protein